VRMTKRNKVLPSEVGTSNVWQGVRFWLPIGLSLTAVILSVLQWIDTHQQKNFSARPLVDFVLENDPDDAAWIGLAIKNNGPAPAILTSVTFYVDHNVVASIDGAAEIGRLNPEIIRSEGYKEGDSLGVGMTEWLFSRSTKNHDDLDKFINFINNRLAAHVTYCSINGECWEKCSSKGRC
jgi:hypothetical protein